MTHRDSNENILLDQLVVWIFLFPKHLPLASVPWNSCHYPHWELREAPGHHLASKWLDALSSSTAPLVSHVLPPLSYQLMQLVGDKVRLWEPPRATCIIKPQCKGTSTYASSALFTKLEDWQCILLELLELPALPLNPKSSLNLFLHTKDLLYWHLFRAPSNLHGLNRQRALVF